MFVPIRLFIFWTKFSISKAKSSPGHGEFGGEGMVESEPKYSWTMTFLKLTSLLKIPFFYMGNIFLFLVAFNIFIFILNLCVLCPSLGYFIYLTWHLINPLIWKCICLCSSGNSSAVTTTCFLSFIHTSISLWTMIKWLMMFLSSMCQFIFHISISFSMENTEFLNSFFMSLIILYRHIYTINYLVYLAPYIKDCILKWFLSLKWFLI